MDYDIKEWAMVSGTTMRFLGRLEISAGVNLIGRIEAGLLVRLDPAFEFAAMLRGDAQGRTVREPLVYPVDFAVFGMPVYVKPTAIYLCAEMTPEDQKTYSQLVEQGLEILNRARANHAGIALPPKGVVGALSR